MPSRVLVIGAACMLVLSGCSVSDARQSIREPTPVPMSTSDADDGRPTVVVGDAAPIEVEVADDSTSRWLGLKGRDEVPPGTGMLFVYDEPVTNTFWMGGVEVPLSIAWVLGDRVVGVAEMQPCPAAGDDCPAYSPGTPFDRAVETTGGAFTAADVRPGDPVVVRGLD